MYTVSTLIQSTFDLVLFFTNHQFSRDDVMTCKRFPVTGDSPSPRSRNSRFDVFVNASLNKRLNKPSCCRCFATPRHSLWHHCNDGFKWCIYPYPLVLIAHGTSYNQIISWLSQYQQSNTKHIEAETKWTLCRRRHFQMHFLERKCMNFD